MVNGRFNCKIRDQDDLCRIINLKYNAKMRAMKKMIVSSVD